MTIAFYNKNKLPSLVIAGYTAYPWENALPMLRFVYPMKQIGATILEGNDYYKNEFHPEYVQRADIVYIQRDFPRYSVPYREIIDLAKKENKPVIYEIDDLLFDTTKIFNASEARYYRPAVGSILEAIINADLVITSTSKLKENLEKLNSNVFVLPNYLNDRIWRLSHKNEAATNDIIKIGYCGTRSHLPDIEAFEPLIQFFQEKYANQVQFHFWLECLPSKLMKYPNVYWKPIFYPNYEDFARWMQTISPDIWMAPLLENEFNQVKSPIKFLEYSSLGIPGVYSDISPYRGIVKHGENGFLANDLNEWKSSIQALIENHVLRSEIGRKAYQTVVDDWLLSNQNEKITELFNKISMKKIELGHYQNGFSILNQQYSEMSNFEQLALSKNQRIIDLEDLLFERSRTIDLLSGQLQIYNSYPPWLNKSYRLAQRMYRKFKSFKSKSLVQLQNTNGQEFGDQTKGMANPKPVSIEFGSPLRLALYTTDNWDTASAHIRLIGPANFSSSNIKILDGCHASTFPDLKFFIQADAIVIQRDFPRHADMYFSLIQWAKQNDKPVIYETDDILYNLPMDHPEKKHFQSIEKNIIEAIKDANAVMASTLPLANELRKLNKNAWLLPNYLDDNIWKLKDESAINNNKQMLAIGYMGGITQTHMPDITFVQNVLIKILKQYNDKVELHFWGVIPEVLLDQNNVIFHKERFPDYRAFAEYFSNQEMDIFIAPLIENEFNDCKSAIKFLEYSSLAVPGIYSSVFPYREVIDHAKNGFLASSEDDWFDYLHYLIENPEERIQIGLNALDTVRRLYLLSRHAQEWGQVYRSAITTVINP
jgi:glycosyltransferase involved in cell wall biosynthesis